MIGARSTIGGNVFLAQSVPQIRSYIMRRSNYASCQNENTDPPTLATNSRIKRETSADDCMVDRDRRAKSKSKVKNKNKNKIKS